MYLLGEYYIVFDEFVRLEDVISKEDVEKIMLIVWFVVCEMYEEVRELTYVELFIRFVYYILGKLWVFRKIGVVIGRVVYVSLAVGDKYFLRILVNVVKGFTCFEDLKIVGGVFFEKYREVCYARGLFDDDREWYDVIEELLYWVTGR